jgi:hypothetical protein
MHIPWLGGGTLDDVTVNGRIVVGGYSGPLDIRNGTLRGDAEIFLVPTAIEGPNRLVSSSPTLTISSSVLVHGGGGAGLLPLGRASGIGDDTANVVNHGTVRAEPGFGVEQSAGEFDLLAPTFFNDGTLGIGSLSFMYASGDVTFGPGGRLEIELSPANGIFGFGMIQATGALDLSSSDILELTAGATIQPLTMYQIATATGGVIGQFDSVTPGFEVMYTSTGIFARVVPEPVGAAGIVVLLSGRGFATLTRPRGRLSRAGSLRARS